MHVCPGPLIHLVLKEPQGLLQTFTVSVFLLSPFSLGKDIVSTDKHERTKEAWQICSSVGTVRKKGQYVFNKPCVIFFSVRLHSYQSHLQLLKLDLTNICLFSVVCPFYSMKLQWREVEKWDMMQTKHKLKPEFSSGACVTLTVKLYFLIILISSEIKVCLGNVYVQMN